MSAVKGRIKNGMVLSNRYKIVTLIGSGGMGNVYLAEDLKLRGKKWAVKETVHHGSPSEFVHEANILTRLSHPGLPDIVDYIPLDSKGYCYIVMDYIEGETLAEKFERMNRSLPAKEIVQVAMQICDIFHYLHHSQKEPLIYRDLKPTNIMVNPHGHIKLIDFGIARKVQPLGVEDTLHLGTFGFAAPEQYEGRTDERTDLYNLGALLYYLFTGGEYAIAGKPLNIQWIPAVMQEMVAKLLDPEAEQRFASAALLKLELERVLSQLMAEQQSEQQTKNPSKKQSSLLESDRSQQKLVVIGGLYAGAGSSFTALTIARLLNKLNQLHAFIDVAGTPPLGLYTSDKQMERLMEFSEIAVTSDDTHIRSWSEGYTTWYATTSSKNVEFDMGNDEEPEGLSWVMQLDEPILLVDIGDRWEVTERLCSEANLLFIVADHQVAGWHSVKTEKRLRCIREWMEAGRQVEFIGNRDVSFKGRTEWLRAFPRKPLCTLPNIDYEQIAKANWQGTRIQDDPTVLSKMQKQLAPIMTMLSR